MVVIEHDQDGNPIRSGKRVAETISVAQLFRMFPTEAGRVKWFEKCRWNGISTCPHRGSQSDIGRPKSKPNYWCGACRVLFNVGTNTPFHATQKPSQKWMDVIHSVVTGRKGVSAIQLSKELGCQYRTAWHMLHRIREACDRGEFTLDGTTETDEIYVGGLEGKKHEFKKLKKGAARWARLRWRESVSGAAGSRSSLLSAWTRCP